MKNLKKENRPWGYFKIISEEESHKMKYIKVLPKHRLSYQYHEKRSEIWIIIEGEAHVLINGEENFYKYGDVVEIPKGSKHRVENKSDSDLIFIEVQTGTYFGEDDITRIEDDYNRI